MHPNDEMALRKKRVYLYFFLVVVLILAGLCGVWALGSIYSSFTEKSDRLEKIEEQISTSYRKRFASTISDDEEQYSVEEMLAELIKYNDTISSQAQVLKNDKRNILTAQERIKEEKQKLQAEIRDLQNVFHRNFGRQLDSNNIIAIKKRVISLENKIKELQDYYSELVKEEQRIKKTLKNYEDTMSSIFILLDGKGQLNFNEQASFIKNRINELSKKIRKTTVVPAPSRQKVKSQTSQTPPKKMHRKRLNEFRYGIEYRFSKIKSHLFSEDEVVYETIKIGCDRHDPTQYEVVYVNKSITQLYDAQTKERIHFYVSSEFIDKGQNTVTANRGLKVRIKPNSNAPEFMLLPYGTRIQQVKNVSIPSSWIEIKFPTEEIYFVVE